MTESFVHQQLQLAQQRRTNELFKKVAERRPPGSPLILLCFDSGTYGDGGFNYACYASNIGDRFALASTLMGLLADWERGIERQLTPSAVAVYHIPVGNELIQTADFCKEALPAGMGFGLVFGLHGHAAYIANTDRASLGALFKLMVANWREDAAPKT